MTAPNNNITAVPTHPHPRYDQPDTSTIREVWENESQAPTQTNGTVVPASTGHTHDGTGTDSTVVAGLADATQPTAAGNQSFAGGDGASATAAGDLALGFGALANAGDSVAVGESAETEGQFGVAVGYGARALGFRSSAMGWDSSARSGSDVVIGPAAGSGTSGGQHVIIGNAATSANNIGSVVAIGDNAQAYNDRDVLLGPYASAVNGTFAGIGIGYQAHPYSDRSIAIGYQAGNGTAADFSVGIGVGAGSAAVDGVAIGDGTGVNSGATAGTALGAAALVGTNHNNSSALGTAASTTKAHQMMLGTVNEVVTLPGGVEYQVLTKTNTDYTLKVTDHTIRYSTGNTNRVATLPPVTTAIIGLTYIIKKVDAGTGTVTVTADTTGTADKIDGATTKVLTNQYDVIVLYAAAADVWDVVKGPGAP